MSHRVICPHCGGSGIHACIGKPLPPWSAEEQKKLVEALEQLRQDRMVTHSQMNMSLDAALRNQYRLLGI